MVMQVRKVQRNCECVFDGGVVGQMDKVARLDWFLRSLKNNIEIKFNTKYLEKNRKK